MVEEVIQWHQQKKDGMQEPGDVVRFDVPSQSGAQKVAVSRPRHDGVEDPKVGEEDLIGHPQRPFDEQGPEEECGRDQHEGWHLPSIRSVGP
jgi:hypothetical protein